MCSSGNSPAQATANSVIASAKRLIDVRHFWCSSRRIAEISVPAWPIPIHQTKLTIAKPQATGTLIPQMPTPTTSSQVTAKFSSITSANAIANPTHHARGVRRVSTIELIRSVTEAMVWPGATTGGGLGWGCGSLLGGNKK